MNTPAKVTVRVTRSLQQSASACSTPGTGVLPDWANHTETGWGMILDGLAKVIG